MGDAIPGAFVEDPPAGPRPIEAVGTAVPAFVGEVSSGPLAPSYIRSWGAFAQGRPLDSPLARAVEDYFRNGGTTAWVAPVTAARPGAVRRAIEAMDRDVTLVAVVSDPPAPADVIAGAAQAMARRRAMLLVEGPWADADEAIRAMTADPAGAVGATGADVAVFWPRVRRIAEDGTEADACALGAIAGVIARTDGARGVSRSPAGPDAVLRGTRRPVATATPAQQEELNGLGVNLVREFARYGTVLWGARTLSADPEWRYVPVRRTFLFLEESIDRGLGWVVFEPNGESLWALVRRSVEAFLLGLFRDGALAGTKPEHAFFVRCDGSTMAQSDIESGRLVCMVGVALSRPAEFVVFRIARRTADAED
jgi:phage tail sheath protein FI